MITLENNFFETKPWGRQGDTVKLFLFMLSNADDTGTINMSIKDLAKAIGVCCSSRIKFSLRQLEYSGNLEIIKVDGKRKYIINTNEKNDKEQNARNADENAAGTKGKKGSIPHTFARW